MNIEQIVQQWVDTFFNGLKRQYANRRLVLLVINQLQSQIDAELPVLVKQSIPMLFSSLKAVVDATFLSLENDTKNLPFLAGLLESLNTWIDAEIDKLSQQVTMQALQSGVADPK